MRDEYDDTIAGERLAPESLMMGYGYRPEWSEGAVKSPIFQTSTFAFQTAEAGKHFFELAYGLVDAVEGEQMGMIYSRLNNPDLEILEDRLTLWDDAERGLRLRQRYGGHCHDVAGVPATGRHSPPQRPALRGHRPSREGHPPFLRHRNHRV